VFNATFNNVSVISWRSVVLVYWWTAPFFYLDMTFSQVKFNTRAADKKDDVSFSIVNFPFLDVDVSLVPSLRWSHFSVRWFVSQLFVIMCLTSITITS